VFADTIRLKDGSLIKGTIVSFVDGRFVVVVGEGARRRELSLAADEIASIEFEPRSATNTARQASESSIVPVSTRPAPKLIISDATTDSAAKTTSPQSQPAADNPIKETQRPIPPVVKPSGTTANTQPKTTSLPANPSRDNVQPSISETSSVKPISLNLKVLADNTANGWTNSGWVVKKGQRIRVTGIGTVSLGRGQTSTPSGLPDLDDDQKLLKSVPTGALIAVIGDDNNDFLYIGESREFTAGRDGALYLGVNEGNLTDNKGAYDVMVVIIPDK
jgi:hypothetical protein